MKEKQNQGKRDIAPDKKKGKDSRFPPTNKDNKITNSEEQNKIDEDVEEKWIPKDKRDDGDPEINTPVYDPNKTEKKIPDMGNQK